MMIRVVSGPAPLVQPSEVGEGVDELIILAAQRTFDGPQGWLNRCIGKQVLEITFDCWRHCYELPCPPHIGIVSVVYDDAEGDEQTISPTDYRLRNGCLCFAADYVFPSLSTYAGAVRVRFEAGYEPDEVPYEARQALIALVQDMAANASTMAPRLRSETVDDIGSVSYVDPDKISVGVQSHVKSLLNGLRVFHL